MAAVLNRVATHTTKQTRAQKRAAALGVTERIQFGSGSGRCAGFYKQMWKRADPAAAEEERKRAEADEAKRARKQHAHEREQREAKEQWARDRQEEQAERNAWAREFRRAEGTGERKRADTSEQHSQHEDDRRQEQSREKYKANSRRDKCAKEKRVDFDSMRCSSYLEYEAAFIAFREAAQREKTLDPHRIPLPPKGSVFEPAANAEIWFKNLRKAMLRWHPDKWAAFETGLPDEASREALKQVVNGMFRAVTRAKERGPPPSARN